MGKYVEIPCSSSLRIKCKYEPSGSDYGNEIRNLLKYMNIFSLNSAKIIRVDYTTASSCSSVLKISNKETMILVFYAKLCWKMFSTSQFIRFYTVVEHMTYSKFIHFPHAKVFSCQEYFTSILHPSAFEHIWVWCWVILRGSPSNSVLAEEVYKSNFIIKNISHRKFEFPSFVFRLGIILNLLSVVFGRLTLLGIFYEILFHLCFVHALLMGMILLFKREMKTTCNLIFNLRNLNISMGI